MEQLDYPLSNVQLELLKLFSRDMEDRDVIEIKRLIVKYLSEKVAHIANEIWDEKQWSDQDMDIMLQKHLRTPYGNKKDMRH